MTDDVKESLADYRHPDDHHSWAEVIEDLLHIVPSIEDYLDGCVYCGDEPATSIPADGPGGYIEWFKVDYDDSELRGANYYCSAECLEAAQDQVRKQVPRRPDLVIVGGREQLPAEVRGASFFIDRDFKEVGIPVPGAFAGESSHGDEYDYIGEPVYIKNEGDWVQHGTIEDIIHEEAHTALMLGSNYEVEMLNHPDKETRENYREHHVTWYDATCPECEADLRVHDKMEDEVECGECGETFDRPPVPDEAND